MAPASSFMRAYLAAAAGRELAIRERRIPAMIAAGDMTRRDGEAEIESWRVIAALFRDRSVETGLTWADLELVTAQALLRREEAVAAAPDKPEAIARRDAVWAIHERIAYTRKFIDVLNRDLRTQARRIAA